MLVLEGGVGLEGDRWDRRVGWGGGRLLLRTAVLNYPKHPEDSGMFSSPQKKGKMHYQIAVIINFLGHCISMVALLVAFFLFLCLR